MTLSQLIQLAAMADDLRVDLDLADIPPIPGKFRAMIAASGALGNGKSYNHVKLA